MNLPRGTYRHHNGNVYEVLMVANIETERPEEYPVTVVYQNVKNKTVWSRPLSEWDRSMTKIEVGS